MPDFSQDQYDADDRTVGCVLLFLVALGVAALIAWWIR